MQWDAALAALTKRLVDDTILTATMGAKQIYAASASRPVKVASVEYLVTYDVEEEIFNRIGVQVDCWAKGPTKAATIERRIRLLWHRDVAQQVNGRRTWVRFLGARELDYPAEPGVIHKALDFEIETIREKYLSPEDS